MKLLQLEALAAVFLALGSTTPATDVEPDVLGCPRVLEPILHRVSKAVACLGYPERVSLPFVDSICRVGGLDPLVRRVPREEPLRATYDRCFRGTLSGPEGKANQRHLSGARLGFERPVAFLVLSDNHMRGLMVDGNVFHPE